MTEPTRPGPCPPALAALKERALAARVRKRQAEQESAARAEAALELEWQDVLAQVVRDHPDMEGFLDLSCGLAPKKPDFPDAEYGSETTDEPGDDAYPRLVLPGHVPVRMHYQRHAAGGDWQQVGVVGRGHGELYAVAAGWVVALSNPAGVESGDTFYTAALGDALLAAEESHREMYSTAHEAAVLRHAKDRQARVAEQTAPLSPEERLVLALKDCVIEWAGEAAQAAAEELPALNW